MKRSLLIFPFTLVELVVVAGTLVLLASLLLPMFGIDRSRAEGIQCTGNEKSIGAAFAQYAADADGRFPTVDFNCWSTRHNYWQGQLAPYLGGQPPDEYYKYAPDSPSTQDQMKYPDFSLKVFQCPLTFDSCNRGKNPDYNGWGSYGINRYLWSTTEDYVDPAESLLPQSTFLMTESRLMSIDSPGAFDSADKVRPKHAPGVKNTLFIDGHVAAFSDPTERYNTKAFWGETDWCWTN